MHITEAAKDHLAYLLKQNNEKSFIRVSLTSGGCKRTSYSIALVAANSVKASDLILEYITTSSQALHIVTDRHCQLHLIGIELDYCENSPNDGWVFSSLQTGKTGEEVSLPI